MITLFFAYTGFEVFVLLFAGFIAGIVNTLAGSGTIFSFGAMLLLGIPITLANTTNRVGVFFQNLSGITAYLRFRSYSWRDTKPEFLVPTLLGALVGAFLAVDVSERWLNGVASFAMVSLLFTITFDLKKRFSHLKTSGKAPFWIVFSTFFVVGLYGGFIQIGIGLLLVSVINLFSGLTLTESNFCKLTIILIYTVPTTLYFIYQDKIIWIPALLLSLGQVGGAFVAGIFSNITSNAEFWIKKLLLLMIVVTLVKIFFF